MTEQNKGLTEQNKGMVRRITYYENAHSPPSQNSACQTFQGPEANPGQEFVA